MDEINTIEQAFPDVRRYAYCLTGDVGTAHELALACLMRWVQEPTVRPYDRVDLFKMFQRLPQLDELRVPSRDDSCDDILDWVLKLPLEQRQALALVVTMGFSYEDAASVLGTDVGGIRKRLARARERLLEMPLRALVIEDDFVIAQELANLLEERGMQVLGPAPDKISAIQLAEASRIDLVLADVALGRDDGVEAVRAIRNLHRSAVIYVTSYPDLVRGDVDAGQVVIKPFSAETIDAAVTSAFAAQLAA